MEAATVRERIPKPNREIPKTVKHSVGEAYARLAQVFA
jgi:hypothetical protein